MTNNLSIRLFERISKLTNTLKLETIKLVNKASEPNKDESEDSTSDDSVILIESSEEVENNLFIKSIREKQECLRKLNEEVKQNYEKNCSSVCLEDLVSISVSLHVNIEDSIEYICNKMGMNPNEVEGFKSPLDESVPVSLFKSNVKQKYFNPVYHSLNCSQKVDVNQIGGSENPNPLNENGNLNGLGSKQVNSKFSSVETCKNSYNFSVNDIPSAPERMRNLDAPDLNSLVLSEETRRLLGLD